MLFQSNWPHDWWVCCVLVNSLGPDQWRFASTTPHYGLLQWRREHSPVLTLARVTILDKCLSPLPTNPFLLRIPASGKLNFISFAVPVLGVTITGFQKEKKGPGLFTETSHHIIEVLTWRVPVSKHLLGDSTWYWQKRRGRREQALRLFTCSNKVCFILQEKCYFLESCPPWLHI